MSADVTALGLIAIAMIVTAGCSAGPGSPAGGRSIAPNLWLGQARPLSFGEQSYQRKPAAAYGDGVYLLAWQDGYNGLGGNSKIRAVRLGQDGLPLDGQAITICPDGGIQDSPSVAFCPMTGAERPGQANNGKGRFLVAWSDFRNGRDYDVFAALLDSTGQVAKPPFMLSGGPGGQALPAVASDGRNTFFVVWQDHRSGKQFDIYGARLKADGTVLDPVGLALLSPGEGPAIAFNGTNFVVAAGKRGCVVGLDGKLVGAPTASDQAGPITLWSETSGQPAGMASAWGRAFAFFNVTPFPSPWGWSGSGSIVGVSVTPDGQSPEFGQAKHDWHHGASHRADRLTRNTVEAARWRNHNGWPMGIPGGFKGSHDGTWPSGRVAAVYNGRSILVVWPQARFLDKLRIANRDLCLKRVRDDWACVDEPRLSVQAGPTEENFPALAAGPLGEAVLTYEVQDPAGGVRIDYRRIVETEDLAPPRVVGVQQISRWQLDVPDDEPGVPGDKVPRPKSEIRPEINAEQLATPIDALVVRFDEPIDPASVTSQAFSIEGVKIESAAADRRGSALMREVILLTEPLKPGRRCLLQINGPADTSKQKNAVKSYTVDLRLKPGRSYKSDFIEHWLCVGPLPPDRQAAAALAASATPSAGDLVKIAPAADLKAQAEQLAPQPEWPPAELAVKTNLAGQKRWLAAECERRSVLHLYSLYGQTARAIALCHTYVYSDQARDVLLRVDGNGGSRVWLNGRIVSSAADSVAAGSAASAGPVSAKIRGLHDYTTEVRARLEEGWNRLLIETDNLGALWALVAQITDLDHRPVRELTYQLDCPTGWTHLTVQESRQ